MLAIKNNLMAEQAARQLGKSYDHLSKSVARLSSGLRINTSGDDAAGLAVRELIRADVAVLKQGSRNARDAISMLQTAEGAMGVVDNILVRMRELAEQSSTESYSSAQRGIMDDEFDQLVEEIDRIAGNTEFNELNLLNDTDGGGKYKIHLGSTEMITIDRADMTAAGLAVKDSKAKATMAGTVTDATAEGQYSASIKISSTDSTFGTNGSVVASFDSATISLNEIASQIGSAADLSASVVEADGGGYTIQVVSTTAGSQTLSFAVTGTDASANTLMSTWSTTAGKDGISIRSAASARLALTSIEEAIKTKDDYRAKLGYLMNRLESATSVIDIQAENLLAAESRISDVDVASEMAAMTRHQVLSQAGISMLSQANTMPQMALSLLQ